MEAPEERSSEPPGGASRGLPFRGSRNPPQRVILATHVVLHGYGHWLMNDPRGSGSVEFRQKKFEALGPIHLGRKWKQPTRQELKEFYRKANELLQHKPFWFNSAKRQALGEAFGGVVATRGWTVWACAVMPNHAHFCIRAHRDDSVTMWSKLTQASGDVMRRFSDVPDTHPVWSQRPYKVFLHTHPDVVDRIEYIEDNPVDAGLPPQNWPFVQPFPRRQAYASRAPE